MAAIALSLAVAAVAAASAPSAAAPATAAAAPTAAPAGSTGALEPADGIPLALQQVTRCMVREARAARGVLAAERGVSVQGGKAFVEVTYRYRGKDGVVAEATYSRTRDEIQLDKDGGMHTEQDRVLFQSILLGAYPMCDRDRHGRPDCRNVRAWERQRPQPVPGWGTEAVRSAWERTCGANTISFTF